MTLERQAKNRNSYFSTDTRIFRQFDTMLRSLQHKRYNFFDSELTSFLARTLPIYTLTTFTTMQKFHDYSEIHITIAKWYCYMDFGVTVDFCTVMNSKLLSSRINNQHVSKIKWSTVMNKCYKINLCNNWRHSPKSSLKPPPAINSKLLSIERLFLTTCSRRCPEITLAPQEQ